MSDVDGAAPAAAEPSPTPDPVDEPEVVHEAEPTPRGAIDRAFDAVEKAKAGDDPIPDGDPPAGQIRDPATGRFVAKPAEGDDPPAEPAADDPDKPTADQQLTNFTDAPTRFSPDAKAAWKDAPEPVRAEITRAVKELEAGIDKYRGDATAFDELRDFAQMAEQQGTTLKQALAHYTGIETMLAENPVQGLQQIAQNMGIPLRDIAGQIAGQKPDEVASQQNATIRDLRQELAAIKQQVGGVTKSIEQQRTDSIMAEVTAFASKPEHTRFDELAADIKVFLEAGRAKDLSEAYQLAERLNPAPAQASPQPAASQPPAATDQQPQTPKGQKSLSGAPNSGSDPASRQVPSTAREAIDRAFATTGIG